MEKFSIISCKIKSLVTTYLLVAYYIDWSLFISFSTRLSVLESHSSVVSIRFMCLCYSVTQIPFRTVTSPLLPLTSCHLAPSFSLYINNFRHFTTHSILLTDIVSVITCSKSPVFCYNRITILQICVCRMALCEVILRLSSTEIFFQFLQWRSFFQKLKMALEFESRLFLNELSF